MTYEQLMKFDSMDSIKKQIIEKETNEIINQDIEQVKAYFIERFNIDISKYVQWNKFKERFFRRNILIHNSGIPNELYRKKTGLQEKEILTVDRKYLNESIKLFDNFANKLTSEFENKFKSGSPRISKDLKKC